MSYGYDDTGWVERPEANEEDVLAIYNALRDLTGQDDFAFADMEIAYGDDFEHVLDDNQYEHIANVTNFAVWYVRQILLDECCTYTMRKDGTIFDPKIGA